MSKERGSSAPWREKWSTNRLPRTGLSTRAAFYGPGRRWRLRQGLWLVAKEGLVPISGQFPTLGSAQKIAGPCYVEKSAHVVVCSTHFGINIAEPLARRRCSRRLSCGHPYSAFFRGRARRGFHSPTWVPRFRVERELLGLSARPPAGLGSRANEDRS